MLKVTDEIGGKWVLTFAELQATKVTTEECAGEILEILPEGGGAVYASETSDWLSFLGKGQIDFLSRSRHFVVPCYDEVVEIVAWEFQVTVGD
ncbi:MAG: hypothetical protein GY927_24780 [bacterium]|nr:hypothetical protein [bacterium]